MITELLELPEINASSGELQQIFINMMTNANDAMKESETKILSITSKQMGDFIQICLPIRAWVSLKTLRGRFLSLFIPPKNLAKAPVLVFISATVLP